MERNTMKIIALAVVAVVAISAVSTVLTVWRNDSGDGTSDLRIAFANSSGMQPMIYAYYSGLYDAMGVKVDASITPSSGPCVTALISGRVDMTFTSPEPVFNVINDKNIKGYYIANSRLPTMSSMHILYNKTQGFQSNMTYVKDVNGDDTGIINFASMIVDADGGIKGKIALHLASSYRTAWLGYVQLLYDGGSVYGVSYADKQINDKQYNKLMNTNDDSVYIGCSNYAAAAAATTRGDALLGIGSNAAMASARDTANGDTGTWEIMSTPSLVDSGYATVLVTEECLTNPDKKEAMIKVLRAIDIAGALMNDKSTARNVAEVCAKYIYSENTEKNIQAELNYYKQVRWDICWIDDVKQTFDKIKEICNLEGDFSTIYNENYVKEIMKAVHKGEGWHRNSDWEYVE